MSASVGVHVEGACLGVLEVLNSYSGGIRCEAIEAAGLVREDVDHRPLVLGPVRGHWQVEVCMSVCHFEAGGFNLDSEDMAG